MAEFVASIIGIVSAGTKVALVLSQLAVDVGSAGHEARMIGGEIRSFCSVLKTLGETIESIEKSPRYAHCSELISDMTSDSLQMFTEILNAVDTLKRMTAGRGGKDGNFGLVERVQWAVFKKPKLLVLRAAIEAYKTNLTLMLSTLSTTERVARPSNADARVQDKQDRSLLECLILDREATLIELVQADQHYEQTAMSDLSEPSTCTINEVSDNGPLSRDLALRDDDSVHDQLINSARKNIQSMRSSLSSNPDTSHEALRTRIARHSRRISVMLEDDHRRLSQRWSLTLQDDIDTASHQASIQPLVLASNQGKPGSLKHKPTSATEPFTVNRIKPATLAGGAVEDSELVPRLEPIYQAFVTYISELGSSQQQQVLRALKRDVAMLNHALRQPPPHSSIDSTQVEQPLFDSNYTSVPSTLPASSPSVASHLSSSSLTPSASASCTSHRPRKARAKALPALPCIQPSSISAEFLSDRSRRPPRQELTAIKLKPHGKSRVLPVAKFERMPNLSTIPTPRQDALAKLTGVQHTSRSPLPPSASLPDLPSNSTTSTLPDDSTSKHRRSRSEHTLTETKSITASEAVTASQNYSTYSSAKKMQLPERRQSCGLTSDTSDDESDNEGSAAWWRSIGYISPHIYHAPASCLSQEPLSDRLGTLKTMRVSVQSPAPSSHGIISIAHVHDEVVASTPPSKGKRINTK